MERRVYGPVPSRRFGLSLGVDLVPHKVCSFDCLYCQCGPTTELLLERRAFFPVEQVLEDVRWALERGPRPQWITLAGSGEPTLYAELEALVDGLKELAPDIPLLVLTNGSLLWREEVRRELRRVDLLVPSLDAGSPRVFRLLDRPHPDLDFETYVEGLRVASHEHPGRVRLEVMLVEGVNDSPEELHAIARIASTLRIEAVDLNSPVRPVPGRGIRPCSPETLARAREIFGSHGHVVPSYRDPEVQAVDTGDAGERILAYLERRPGTAEDLARALGLHAHVVAKELARALADGRLAEQLRDGRRYYYPKR